MKINLPPPKVERISKIIKNNLNKVTGTSSKTTIEGSLVSGWSMFGGEKIVSYPKGHILRDKYKIANAHFTSNEVQLYGEATKNGYQTALSKLKNWILGKVPSSNIVWYDETGKELVNKAVNGQAAFKEYIAKFR